MYVPTEARDPDRQYVTNGKPRGGRHMGLKWKSIIIPELQKLLNRKVLSGSKTINAKLAPLIDSIFPRNDIRDKDVRVGQKVSACLLCPRACVYLTLFVFEGENRDEASVTISGFIDRSRKEEFCLRCGRKIPKPKGSGSCRSPKAGETLVRLFHLIRF